MGCSSRRANNANSKVDRDIAVEIREIGRVIGIQGDCYGLLLCCVVIVVILQWQREEVAAPSFFVWPVQAS